MVTATAALTIGKKNFEKKNKNNFFFQISHKKTWALRGEKKSVLQVPCSN